MKKKLFRLYLAVVTSIAFYPAMIALGFFFFALVIMYIEYLKGMYDLKEKMAFLLINNVEDGRLILGTLVGSIISLMVFSFSMVMVVLNRASATLSPRVIPGLINEKSHQTVLGVYIGTIVYSLILIINIQNPEADHQIPSVGIFFATSFGLLCLVMFIFFIDSISHSIQVDNVIEKILNQTLSKMDRLSGEVELELNTEGWKVLKAQKSGYFKRVQSRELLELCTKHNLEIAITEPQGFFLVEGYPFLRVKGKLNKQLEQLISNTFVFYSEEHITDHYFFGFKQISEIAVKALSPGINDPATAVKAIDMLSVLFIKKMNMKERIYLKDKDGAPRLYFKEIKLDDLLYYNLTPIQEYGKKDMQVMMNVLESLKNMLYISGASKEDQQVLLKYTESVLQTCQNYVEIKMDLEAINQLVGIINHRLNEDKFEKIPLEKLSKK